MSTVPAQSDHLDETDLAFHRTIINRLREANVAVATWSDFLTMKYGLTPLDRVEEGGMIVRVIAVGQEQEEG